MSAERIKAPWSEEQVMSLIRYQAEEPFHPFTCAQDHTVRVAEDYYELMDSSPLLIPTPTGWMCSWRGCDYTQDWAWDFMTIYGREWR